MKTVIFTVGAPGSGKTTFAKNFMETCNEIVIDCNRDDYRDFFTDGAYSRNEYNFDREVEAKVTNAQNLDLEFFLDHNPNVYFIFSDTNLNVKLLRKSVNNLLNHDIMIEFRTFFDVPLDELIRRNEIRIAEGKRSVPEHVIIDMYNRIPVVNAYLNEVVKENNRCQIIPFLETESFALS